MALHRSKYPGRSHRRMFTSRPHLRERHSAAFSIGGLLLLGAALYVGISLFPEAWRTVHVHRM